MNQLYMKSANPGNHDPISVIQCVILLGGLGTRLRPIVNDRPKALANIIDKPFLHYQIRYLAKNGIKEIILCTGYMGERIRDYIDEEIRKHDSLTRHITIKFSDEGDSSLGTGGALKHARYLLNDRFFLLNGDTLFLSDLKKIEWYHLNSTCDLTIGLTKVQDFGRYGLVDLENNSEKFSRILSFQEKKRVSTRSTVSPIISAGLYLFEKRAIEWTYLPEKFSLEHDLLPEMLTKYRIYGYLDKFSYFVDMGTPEGYKRLQEDIIANKIVI